MIHEFAIVPEMFDKIVSGQKWIEFRVGEKAQRVRPLDSIQFTCKGTFKVVEKKVWQVHLLANLEDGTTWAPTGSGYKTWEEIKLAMNGFYGLRSRREPFTILCLEPPWEKKEES